MFYLNVSSINPFATNGNGGTASPDSIDDTFQDLILSQPSNAIDQCPTECNDQIPEAIQFYTRVAQGEQLMCVPEKIFDLKKQLEQFTGIRSEAGMKAVKDVILSGDLGDENGDGTVGPEDLIATYTKANINPDTNAVRQVPPPPLAQAV